MGALGSDGDLGPSGGAWSVGTVPSSTTGSRPYIPVPEALLLPTREALAGARRKTGFSASGRFSAAAALRPVPVKSGNTTQP